MNKKISIIYLIAMMLLNIGNIKAQVSGYGNESVSDPNPTVTPPCNYGDRIYTDDIRAKVTSISTSGSSATLNIAYPATSYSFNVGDEVLLIQMKGVNNGLHQNAVVTGTGGTLNLTAVSGSFLTGYTAGPPDMLQVIRIYNYNTLILNGGIVLCHPWNDADGTGGIICLIDKGNLTVNSGFFFASGRGFTADDAFGGVNFKPDASGVAPNPSNTFSVSAINLECVGSLGSVPINPPCAGSAGGAANPATAASSTLNTGTGMNYGAPTSNNRFIIGTPGYYQPGYGGGLYNAGGGGQGGAGGGGGSAGGLGGWGQNGGGAGHGGTAGGGIYIKAYNITVNTNAPCFYARGSNAQYGHDGGWGGAGGAGGTGTAGCTSVAMPAPSTCSVSLPAAPGAWGDNGTGGDAGDGGDGGYPGTMWIATPNTVGGSGFVTGNFDVYGGKGGLGGYQGMGGGNGSALFIPNILNTCDGSTCLPPPISGVGCSPDPIFCALQYVINGYPTASPVGVSFDDNLGNKVVTYDYASATLSLWGSAGTVLLQQVGIDGGAAGALNALNVLTDIANYWVSFGGGTSGSHFNPDGNCGSAGLCDVLYSTAPFPYGPPYPDEFAFYHFTQPITPYFEELVGTNAGTKIYFVKCGAGGPPGAPMPPGPPCPKCPLEPRPRQGRNGVDAPNGTIDLTGTKKNANVLVTVPAYWKRATGIAESQDNIQNLLLYPNPTGGDVLMTLNSNANSDAQITVTDIAGRVVYSQKVKLQKGNNKQLLPLDGLAKGAYTMELQSTDGKYVKQIMVK